MWLPFKGGVYFIGKPADINDSWIGYVRATQQRLLDAGSSTMQPLSSAVSRGKELYNTNSPSASPVTVIRIIWIHVRVPHVAAAAIQGWGLVEEIRYHHHYGVCKTFAIAAAATTNLTSREVKARNSLNLCLSKQIFAFESIAAHDLISRKKFNSWNLWVDQHLPTQII